MTDTSATGTGTETGQENQQQGQQQEQSFTQADLDQMAAKVRSEERRKASEKFADYDDLKKRADGAKTLEERFAEMETRTAKAETAALRSDIAAKYAISTEDRDVFLTGTDKDTLEAQAKRLSELAADPSKKKPVARNEGGTKSTGTSTEQEARQFARSIFGGGD